MMQLPDEIISAAMLGTAQNPGRPAGLLPAGPLATLLEQVELPAEGKLLLAAAGLHLQQQAGWQPPQTRPARTAPCEPDEEPLCPFPALRHLTVMLNNLYQQLLPEWLAELARSGRRVPEQFLPLLLDTGRRLPDLQPALRPLLGKRGLWLAQEAAGSRQWEWANQDKAENIWQEGKREERLALLKRLRQHDPARARQFLQASWSSEPARDREEFLRLFETGLSADDEPFLEEVLNDRARGPGQVAAALLARLPTSAYTGRMQQRLGQLLELDKNGELRGTALESGGNLGKLKKLTSLLVKEKRSYRLILREDALPDPADLERDRIAAYPAKGVKETAGEWLLTELLGCVAPTYLANRWAISFADLLAAAQESGLAVNFINSWADACSRTADAPFALFLLRQLLPQLSPPQIASLVPLLPPADVEAVIRAALESPKPELNHNHPVFPVIQAYAQPWSDELATLFMARLGRYLQRGNVRPAHETRTALLHIALYLPPGRSDELLRVLDVETSAPKAWEDMVDEIRLLLTFRREMREAIYEESKQ